jgi:hypothetical protein
LLLLFCNGRAAEEQLQLAATTTTSGGGTTSSKRRRTSSAVAKLQVATQQIGDRKRLEVSSNNIPFLGKCKDVGHADCSGDTTEIQGTLSSLRDLRVYPSPL